MKFLIQCVEKADVTVNSNIIGSIDKGLLVFVGISQNLMSVNGELLIISQFTLYADCKHGNRPSFIDAGKPDMANELYNYIIKKCRETVPVVQQGEFGADMKVSLVNDGPFTIMLDSDDFK